VCVYGKVRLTEARWLPYLSVRLSDGECAQVIVHPAISVWTVSTMPNGDIVSGSSDGIVRVFSEAKERWANAEDIKVSLLTSFRTHTLTDSIDRNTKRRFLNRRFLRELFTGVCDQL
jgi:hypothetical protein